MEALLLLCLVGLLFYALSGRGGTRTSITGGISRPARYEKPGNRPKPPPSPPPPPKKAVRHDVHLTIQ